MFRYLSKKFNQAAEMTRAALDERKAKARNREAVQLAVSGDFTAALALVAQGADPNYISYGDEKRKLQGKNIGVAAIRAGKAAALEQALDLGLDPNLRVNDVPLLIISFVASYPDVTGLLLDRGADPNAVDEKGKPALVRIVEYGNPHVARLMLKHGAGTGPSGRGLSMALGIAEQLNWMTAFVDEARAVSLSPDPPEVMVSTAQPISIMKPLTLKV